MEYEHWDEDYCYAFSDFLYELPRQVLIQSLRYKKAVEFFEVHAIVFRMKLKPDEIKSTTVEKYIELTEKLITLATVFYDAVDNRETLKNKYRKTYCWILQKMILF